MLVEVSLGAGREDPCAAVPWGCQLMGDFPVSLTHSVCWRGGTEGNEGAALGAVNCYLLFVWSILAVSCIAKGSRSKIYFGWDCCLPIYIRC